MSRKDKVQMAETVVKSAKKNLTDPSESLVPPFRVEPYYSPRPWGTRDLQPWADSSNLSENIGELWLTGDESKIATGKFAGQTLATAITRKAEAILGHHHLGSKEFPLLVKMLFPKEKLSVQVHPDDALAQRLGNSRGKTECWYVLDAELGAAVALGFRERRTVSEIDAAIKAGTLEALLNWVPVTPGDMIFVDAGTVHAIGPGSVLLEVQQQSDLTYRLYDYGRPRELHLRLGFEAMRLETAAGKVTPKQVGSHMQLISTNYFQVDQLDVAAGQYAGEDFQKPGIAQAIFIANGEGMIDARGCEAVTLRQGQLAVIPATSPDWRLQSHAPMRAIIASAPHFK